MNNDGEIDETPDTIDELFQSPNKRKLFTPNTLELVEEICRRNDQLPRDKRVSSVDAHRFVQKKSGWDGSHPTFLRNVQRQLGRKSWWAS